MAIVFAIRKGSQAKNARLTERDIPLIRAAFDARSESVAALARRYDVSVETIRNVGYRRRWLHVPENHERP